MTLLDVSRAVVKLTHRVTGACVVCALWSKYSQCLAIGDTHSRGPRVITGSLAISGAGLPLWTVTKGNT